MRCPIGNLTEASIAWCFSRHAPRAQILPRRIPQDTSCRRLSHETFNGESHGAYRGVSHGTNAPIVYPVVYSVGSRLSAGIPVYTSVRCHMGYSMGHPMENMLSWCTCIPWDTLHGINVPIGYSVEVFGIHDIPWTSYRTAWDPTHGVVGKLVGYPLRYQPPTWNATLTANPEQMLH